MFKINRKVISLFAAMALLVGAMVIPTAASAGGKVPFKLTGPLKLATGGSNGGTLKGKFSGNVGNTKVTKASVTGTVAPPKLTAVIHLAGGTLVLKSKDGHIVKGELQGTVKVSGTGKYAGASGSGSMSASLVTFVYTFKGKVTL